MSEKPILIYICLEDDSEKARTAKRIQQLVEGNAPVHPEFIFVSPLHAFGYLKHKLPPEQYTECRLALLDMCDCLLTFGSNSMSDMCMKEKEYAVDHRICVWDMMRESRLPEAERLRIGAW